MSEACTELFAVICMLLIGDAVIWLRGLGRPKMKLWIIGLIFRWIYRLWKGSERLFDWWNKNMWTPAVTEEYKKQGYFQ